MNLTCSNLNDPVVQGYSSPVQIEQMRRHCSALVQSGSSLPYTGISLLWIVLAAVVIIGIGLFLRRGR